jgi:hypothetical protein
MALNKHLANVSAYAETVYALTQGACTVFDLSEESGLGLITIRKFVAALKRRGLIRVAAWETDRLGRSSIAAYTWGRGRGKDAPRPPRKTMAERRATYYQKLQRLAIERGTSVKHTRVRNELSALRQNNQVQSSGVAAP